MKKKRRRSIKDFNFKFRKLIGAFTFTVLVCGVIFIATPQKSFAYEKEAHFWFTYYLAVKSGYTDIQAMQVASGDVSVDFDSDTVPEFASIRLLKNFLHPQDFYQEVRTRFHALPHKQTVMRKAGAKDNEIYWWDPTPVEGEKLKISDELARERRDEFWEETLKDPVNPGPFLHYLQDMYPHRGFLSYIGHPGYYYADFIASDKDKARRMAFETVQYLIAFREVYYGKKPAADFKNVQAIDVSDYLTKEAIADIEKTITKLAEANPSPGRQENVLAKTWLGLSDSQRNTDLLFPPKEFIPALSDVKENYRSVDSSKARKAIKEVLGYEWTQMPDIWIYDLGNYEDKSLFKKESTSKVMIYQKSSENDERISPNGILSKQEASNTKNGKRKDSKGRKLCLPAALVDKSVKRVPPCKKSRWPF